MKLFISDLDDTLNTISESRARLVPEDRSTNLAWAVWHHAHIMEQPKHENIEIMNRHLRDGWEGMIWSARNDSCLTTTVKQVNSWLVKPAFTYDLRAAHDHRSPLQMKLDKLIDIVRRYQPEIILVMEDDPAICEAININAELNEYGRPVGVIQVPQTGFHV